MRSLLSTVVLALQASHTPESWPYLRMSSSTVSGSMLRMRLQKAANLASVAKLPNRATVVHFLSPSKLQVTSSMSAASSMAANLGSSLAFPVVAGTMASGAEPGSAKVVEAIAEETVHESRVKKPAEPLA